MSAKPSKQALSVLIVDDNQPMCHNVRDILEAEGYRSQCVYDGLTAIEQVKRSIPDVILMDIRLPGINGVQAFREIKRIAPCVSVIMITGFSVDELVEEAIREGAHGYLKKPLDFSRLFALIEEGRTN